MIDPATLAMIAKFIPTAISVGSGFFKNEDPDKDLWAEQVKRLTGHDADGWGSGGDWSAWLMQKYGLDKGTGDHYGALIRQKQMSPDQAISEITGGESSSAPESRGGGVSNDNRFSYEVPELPNIPEFQRPERFDSVQGQLEKIGTDILGGQPGEYFGAIGETGGKLFEDMIKGISTDVSRSVEEAKVASGRARGGSLGELTAEKVGEMSSKLRWDDMARAITGRQFLLGTGTNILSGVRGAEAGMAGMESSYGLNKAQLEQAGILDTENMKLNVQRINDAYESNMISLEQRDQEIALAKEKFGWEQDVSRRDFDWKKDTYEDTMLDDIGDDLGGLPWVDTIKKFTDFDFGDIFKTFTGSGGDSSGGDLPDFDLGDIGLSSNQVLPNTTQQSGLSSQGINAGTFTLPTLGKARKKIPTYA